MQLFAYQTTIGKNIKEFLCNKGYTKTSFCRLVNVSIPTLNQIIDGNAPNSQIYNEHIKKITETLNLPYDYFLSYSPQKLDRWQISTQQEKHNLPERNKLAQELLEDLDELIIVAAFYIK